MTGPVATRRGRRAGLVVVDQALSTLVGFLLSLLCLKSLPGEQFALFTLLYGWYVAVQCGIRALTGEVAYARLTDRSGAARQATTAAAALAVAVALVLAAVGVLLSAAAVLAFAAVLPAAIAQSALRWAALACYRPGLAVLSDAVFLAAFAGSTIGLTAAGRTLPLPALVLLWGGSAALAAAVVVGHPVLRPAWSSPLRWLHTTRRFGLPFLAEAVSQSGLNAITPALLAAIAGLHQLALFTAVGLMFGPVTMLRQASAGLLVGEFVGVGGRPAAVRRLARTSNLLLASAVAGWTAVIAVVPASVIHALAGQTAVSARPLVLYYGATLALLAMLDALQAAVRALQRVTLAFWCRLAGALCLHVSVLVGGWADGGLVAARASVVGATAAFGISFAGLRVSLHGQRAEPATVAASSAAELSTRTG